MTDLERQVQLDFYRKLLARLESIDITLDEINTTLKRFGSYMPEPSHPEIRAGVD